MYYHHHLHAASISGQSPCTVSSAEQRSGPARFIVSVSPTDVLPCVLEHARSSDVVEIVNAIMCTHSLSCLYV
ncbi:hypothetical protein RRG08_011267 [Elysia crispata]|uniref:Uncharacterized protein n=1 Tax=Elysia crispata TaxID=231223 RepID=A0AAE0YJ53_9GAST|nr:hypothetical protein RRG08_011267 [Elysia crispata]